MKVAEKISKKQIIVNAAADLFKDKGYKAASIRDLATKVGLEPSSIYSHIKSKEELLGEICMGCAMKFTEGMKQISNSDISAQNKVKTLIALHLNIAFDNLASITVFNDEWRYLPEPILSEFLVLRKDYEKKFKKILTDGKSEHVFYFEHTDIVFNVIIKTLSWSYSGVKKYKKDELQQELTRFILHALDKNLNLHKHF